MSRATERRSSSFRQGQVAWCATILLLTATEFLSTNGFAFGPSTTRGVDVNGWRTTTLCSNLSISTSSSDPLTLYSTTGEAADTDPTAPEAVEELDSKDMVKVFGRLAEKYIMLDGSAGLCCYSACADCEYREPGGGYRMADQSAARPKWIPSYEERKFETLGKEHTTKWSQEIFTEGPAVSKEQFVQRVSSLKYAPPLGGPFLSASSAGLDENDAAVARFFDVLIAEGKEVLTKHRMSTQLKVLAGGEEGMTWPKFEAAMSPN